MVVVAEPTLRPVQALVRWDPAGFAARELAERAELGFPPVSRMAALTGRAGGGGRPAGGRPSCPTDAEVLGPVPLPVTDPGRPRRPGDPPPGEQLGAGAAAGAAGQRRGARRGAEGGAGRPG